MGVERIKRNLGLSKETDAVEYCRRLISDSDAKIYRNGKNWYVEICGCRLTVNARSLTIITAHKLRAVQ